MKKTKHPRSRAMLIGILVLVVALTGIIGIAATYKSPTYGFTNTGNPDDGKGHFQMSESDGLIKIEQSVADGDKGGLYIGKQLEIDCDGDGTKDYLYTYGYYYNGTGEPKLNNLNDWVVQDADLGWGCAALKKNRVTYPDPAGVLDGQPLTWMTNAYRNCTAMKTSKESFWALPRIPGTVLHTNYMFAGCTGLTHASFSTLNTISANTFNGCTNLKDIFLGQNVRNVAANAFNGLTNCELALDAESKPANFVTNWDKGLKSVRWDHDIYIWAVQE